MNSIIYYKPIGGKIKQKFGEVQPSIDFFKKKFVLDFDEDIFEYLQSPRNNIKPAIGDFIITDSWSGFVERVIFDDCASMVRILINTK